MNKMEFAKIINQAVSNHKPLRLSQATELAECVDENGMASFTDKNNHDWHVMNGRQLKITILSFPELTDEINKIHEISPIDYNVITVSIQNLKQLVKDVSYDGVYKPSFEAPLARNLSRLDKALARLANTKIDVKFIKNLVGRIMSHNINLNGLYKYPDKPSLDRLITSFDYVDDTDKTKDLDLE